MATELDKKPTKSFNCELCDYLCSNKKDFNKHLLTRKHQVATNLQQNCPQKSLYKCDCCEKEYQDRTGLWRHKQGCKPNDPLLEKVEQNIQSIMALSNFY